jgi:hypothetical protein
MDEIAKVVGYLMLGMVALTALQLAGLVLAFKIADWREKRKQNTELSSERAAEQQQQTGADARRLLE